LLFLQGHGPDGFGGESGVVEASVAAAASRKNAAVHALSDLSHKHKGDLVVIAVGPLTNVALAMLLDPDFVDNVKRFVVMGGLSRGEGNLTPHAEFNVGCDPEATNIVYEHCTGHPEKLLVVPFETTKDCALPWSVFEELFAHKSTRISDYIHRLWSFTKSVSRYNFMPCDAYAVAPLLHSGVITKARVLKGHIHLGLDAERGANKWSDEENRADANVTLITDMDTAIFTELLRRLAV
jgi:purine nucleosidase